jgi:hypothetical protein
MLHVVVTEAAELRARHQTAIHNGGVVDLVGEDVITAAHHGGDDGQVGGIARCVGDGGFFVLEIRDRLFEFVVNGQRASQCAHAVRARAEFVHGFFGGFVNARVADQPKVAVGGVHAHFASANAHFRSTHHLFHGLVVEI